MKCEICKTTFLNTSSFYSHLWNNHKINSEQYYNKIIGPVVYCKCGKKAKFVSVLDGYKSYCSRKCFKGTEEHILMKSKMSVTAKSKDYLEINAKRRKTNNEKYGVDYIVLRPEHSKMTEETCLRKYGTHKNFKNPEQLNSALTAIEENYDLVNEKRKNFWTEETKTLVNLNRLKTIRDKYSVDNVSMLDFVKMNVKKTNIESGYWTLQELGAFDKYRNDIKRLTKLNISELFLNWDGTCYYSNKKLVFNDEYRLSNPGKDLSCNLLQPTVDHKISAIYGFKNGISAEDISDISNLCICSREMNSKKNYMTEMEFLECLQK